MLCLVLCDSKFCSVVVVKKLCRFGVVDFGLGGMVLMSGFVF